MPRSVPFPHCWACSSKVALDHVIPRSAATVRRSRGRWSWAATQKKESGQHVKMLYKAVAKFFSEAEELVHGGPDRRGRETRFGHMKTVRPFLHMRAAPGARSLDASDTCVDSRESTSPNPQTCLQRLSVSACPRNQARLGA